MQPGPVSRPDGSIVHRTMIDHALSSQFRCRGGLTQPPVDIFTECSPLAAPAGPALVPLRETSDGQTLRVLILIDRRLSRDRRQSSKRARSGRLSEGADPGLGRSAGHLCWIPS